MRMVRILGLAFTGAEGPEGGTVQKLLEEAGRRSERLIIAAADSGLDAAERAGIRPGWIVGDMDSLSDPGRLDAYPQDRVLRYGEDKDYTDTELALSLLREQGAGEVWLAGGGGGRMDHLFAIRALFEREQCPARWVTAGEDMFCINEGQGLSRRLPHGGLVSVFPLGEGPWRALSRNLKWPLDRLSWNRGFFGVSNRAEPQAQAAEGGAVQPASLRPQPEGPYTVRIGIHAEQGRFLAILPPESEDEG
ncbi:MAG: thiamine diphosphokinase [Treponema sp.]|nr:thiamine diphosphokinase [Treponema sp.]